MTKTNSEIGEKPWVEIPIPSRPGKFMKLDEEDVELLEGRNVCLTNKGYPNVWLDGKHVLVHRLVMKEELDKAPDGTQIDHKHHDLLDARKSNLRLCTIQENNQNVRKRQGKCSSKFKGVNFFKRDQKWRAQIRTDKGRKYLGLFDTELEAAKAYNEACLKYHKDFARPNNIIDEDVITFVPFDPDYELKPRECFYVPNTLSETLKRLYKSRYNIKIINKANTVNIYNYNY